MYVSFSLFRCEPVLTYAMVIGLSELVDDEPKEVRLPIICGSEHLRANFISDQTEKTHDYKVVGWLTTTVELDSGLDTDHEKYAKTQTARHEFEQYDVVVCYLFSPSSALRC